MCDLHFPWALIDRREHLSLEKLQTWGRAKSALSAAFARA
jgi:hypothetical protein